MLALCLATATAQATPPPAPPPTLPMDVARLLAEDLPDADLRVFPAQADLDGDGRDEWLAYVASPQTCGTGGCPLYVIAPTAHGYRTVSRIGPVQVPIHLSPERRHGWTSLVVSVGGGGIKGSQRRLDFDGRHYPPNPTVTRAGVTLARLPSIAPLIADFQSFTDGQALPTADALRALPAGLCAPLAGAAARLLQKHAALRAQQRDLTATCERAQPVMAAGAAAQRLEWVARQQALAAEAQACARQPEPSACLAASLARRSVDLRIGLGEIRPAPSAVGFVCPQQPETPVSVDYYSQTEPRALRLTVGQQSVLLFAQPSGSGARYGAPPISFWEHQGEATVEGFGPALICRKR